MVFTLEHDPNNRVSAILPELFKRIYPTWSGAAEWPMKSFRETWALWEPVISDPGRDRNEFRIVMEREGIISATFGVPPDWAMFTATTRDQCIPDMRDRDLLRRVIC
jgi:hypothetical protein